MRESGRNAGGQRVKKPTPKKPGRPREHDRFALGRELCSRIAQGELVKDAAVALGITAGQVRLWASEDEEFKALYARAREDQAHAIAEQALAIADGFDPDSEKRMQVMADQIEGAEDDDKDRILESLATVAVARDRIRVDARKWLASKIAPREYGERQTVEHEGKITFELASRLKKARERVK